MYKKSGEFVDHVLLHCEFACHLWSLVFCLFVYHWVIPERVWDFYQSADLWGAVLYASCGPFGENAIYLKRLNTLLDLNFFFLCTMNDWMATPCMIGFIFLCAL